MTSTQLCRTADGNCGQGDEQTSTPSFAPDFRNSGLRTRRRPFGLLRPSLLFSGHSGAALDLSSTPEAIAGDPISSRPSPACSFSSCESCSRFHRDARSVDLLNHRAMWTRTYWRLSRAAGPLVHTAVIRLAPHRFQAVCAHPAARLSADRFSSCSPGLDLLAHPPPCTLLRILYQADQRYATHRTVHLPCPPLPTSRSPAQFSRNLRA